MLIEIYHFVQKNKYNKGLKTDDGVEIQSPPAIWNFEGQLIFLL